MPTSRSPIAKSPSSKSSRGSSKRSSPAVTGKRRAATSSSAADPGTIPAIFAAVKKQNEHDEHDEPVDPPPEDDEEEDADAAAAIAAIDAAVAAEQATAAANDAMPPITEAENALLRSFDMNQEYGPCVGPTRLQRWHRADKWDLKPPAEVLAILERLSPDHPEQDHLWRHRNL